MLPKNLADMLLIIDNYDSFVHNLARYLRRLGAEAVVVRNDRIDADAVERLRPAGIVLSPGPCTPREAGCSIELVRRFTGEMPILGVCLGHQAIGTAFGAEVVRAPAPMHGRTSAIEHTTRGLFEGVPTPFSACRYHSLVIDRDSMSPELETMAWTHDGVVMGVAHRDHPTFGVQFHPEAILTECGYTILANFLARCGITGHADPNTLAASERAFRTAAVAPLPARPVTF